MGATANVMTKRSGPAPHPPRDGDKEQARHRINIEVRTGRRPHPNSLPCVDCGHVWKKGERRHEYDHHKGYAAKHHHDVEAVCTICHAKRDSTAASRTACVHGHPFTKKNTYLAKNGTRHCRECRRTWDRGRRDAAYWRTYRARRKSNG